MDDCLKKESVAQAAFLPLMRHFRNKTGSNTQCKMEWKKDGYNSLKAKPPNHSTIKLSNHY
jgi:hypothetical protein